MQQVTPFLWFKDEAEDAVKFYKGVFPKLKVVDRMDGPDGAPITIGFELFGMSFVALNGNHEHAFNPSVSFAIACRTQREIDRYWSKLSAGGTPMMCGWVADKYGVAWQVVPAILPDLLQDEDPERAGRVMQAMLKMRKFDIAKLKAAHRGAARAKRRRA